MSNRRKLIVALGASALLMPFGSFAQQQGKVWRIGYLNDGGPSDDSQRRRFDAFKAGMRDLGYVEGKNLVIEQRSAENDLTRLPALAAKLVALKVDLIIIQGTPAAVAARNATRDIPILITTVSDPVGSGLAATLSHPGGNVTGLTNGVASELYTKRLDLLRQMLPDVDRVGFLYNPNNSGDPPALKQFESDCRKLQIKSIPAPVRKKEEIAQAFEMLKRNKAQALLVSTAGTNNAWRDSIIEAAARHRLPAAYGVTLMAESGGLISYSANSFELYKRAAAYADKIFKGANPRDLPIEQPIKFETTINLKTAKALGIKIPDVVMLRADKVIE